MEYYKQVIKDTETAINNANTTKTNLENAIADAIEDTNEAKEALSQYDFIKTIKSDAYKEFATKLKLHRRKMSSSDFSGEFWDYAVLEESIDSTLKELED